ncbi:MAG: hypothetical protein K5989_04015 [Lachnospiraceae bacterium]|nr:hypothetical protein [Lachnospiraceae bacterium]
MRNYKKLMALMLNFVLCFNLCACASGSGSGKADSASDQANSTAETGSPAAEKDGGKAGDSAEEAGSEAGSADKTAEDAGSADKAVNKTTDMTAIEEALNLANMDAEWTYSDSDKAWTLSVVTAVTKPEIEDEQGVSVCVPGSYVKGIDTDGDGTEDETSGTVKGKLVIDYDASITSTNGQIYTAATAPVIINTGAAGYSEQSNQTAGTTYASEGFINVACGNRGKQSTLEDGTFTGDAPCCLVDQKNAVRFVKYNILLGNLPGSVDYFVSTGGSGGGAHASMLAATSDNPDFYDYEIAAGAVGVYQDSDGNYITSVTLDGKEVDLSDGMWGCMAYSAITSLAEADMALAFEYYLDPTYSFNTDFQKQVAEYLAAEYMEYINAKKLKVKESAVGFDLNGDGDTEDEIDLTIEYDAEKHGDTNGYYGTYVDLYLAELQQSLNDYIARLDYAEDWTWFDAEGKALSDSEVASMTTADRGQAFIEGRYAKGSTGSSNAMGGPGGPGGNGGPGGDNAGGPPDMNGGPEGNGGPGGDNAGGPPDMNGGPGGDNAGSPPDMNGGPGGDNAGGPPNMSGNSEGQTEEVGTPDAGTTQSASSKTDSSTYSSFEEMLDSYQADIAEIEAGDAYGNNIVELYDPTNYIGAEGTNNPTWARVLMGASEGDISMFNSLNMQIAWLNAGTDAEIEWQWNGGHVPSEIFGDSLALYVDTMYGKHVDGAVSVSKAAAKGQSENGTATEADGSDLSGWVTYDSDKGATFALADAANYRTSGASKAIPGFDVMDYGQEDYVFGSSTADARHWDRHVLDVFEAHKDELSELFN